MPNDHRLPFGPHDLSVIAQGELLPGGGRAGFEIFSEGPSSASRLNWTLILTVRRVNSKGSPERVVGRRKVLLRGDSFYQQGGIKITAAISSRPGFYRGDLTIDRPRHSPVTFSHYTRVVPRRYNVSLRLRQSSYLPGETLAMRLENRGTVNITYGIDRYLNQWDGIRWVPVEGEEQFFPPVGIALLPGAVGKCERVLLAADLQPGRYRVEKRLGNGRFARAYFYVHGS